VIWAYNKLQNFTAKVLHELRNHLYKLIPNQSSQDGPSVFRTPDEVIVDIVDSVTSFVCAHISNYTLDIGILSNSERRLRHSSPPFKGESPGANFMV